AQRRALLALRVLHGPGAGAPEAAVELLVVGVGELLHRRALAVEELDALRTQLRIDAQHALGIGRAAVARRGLEHQAALGAAGLLAGEAPAVLAWSAGGEVLERELAADERPGSVARRDALGAAARRQVQPLLVLAAAVRMREHRRALDVGRVGERDEGAIAFV